MTFNNCTFQVSKTAHYSTYGTLSKKTKYIWFFLHGYGQLSRKTIQKFDFLDENEHFVIAPEGLSRFYWHSNNEPVASWMTKEDRYDEIEDFVNYLDALYSRYTGHVNRKVKIMIMGFSQGCATAWRWIHASQPFFNVLVNWAGWIPEDISYQHLNPYLRDKELILCVGNQDKYLTPQVLEGIQGIVRENSLDLMIKEFDGGHKIPPTVLRDFVNDHIL